jgi:hypothetical protein
VSRISCTGREIGNSIFDLDRILAKTIQYERDTVSGRNLDWRSNALSVITNYGAGNWDTPLLKAEEKEGGTFEQYSTAGWMGDLPPLNVLDSRPPSAELMSQTHRRGLLATMSHGWNRGCEGLTTQEALFRDIDPRWPSVVSVAACTGLALGDNCNLGQAWLRTGGVFVNGTGWSGNNNCRIPLHTRILTDRVSVGEAAKNEVVQYGDPSLHVLPPKGEPLRTLQISPAFTGHYEERTIVPGQSVKPFNQTYTLTNRSRSPITFTAETDAPWIDLSLSARELQPGDSATVQANSNGKMGTLGQGVHLANVRFRRADGQIDDRRLAVNLQPVSLSACFSFDAVENGSCLPDLTTSPGFARGLASLWLTNVAVNHHNKAVTPGKEKVAGLAFDPNGKVGGALHLEKPEKSWSRALPGYTQWRGTSMAFWLKIDELPPAKKQAAILSAPFAIAVDSNGVLTFSQGGKPAALGTIKPGDWHFIQLRSDLDQRKVKASLDGAAEVSADAPKPPATLLAFGAFSGWVDELKVWSGELTDAGVAAVLASANQPYQPQTSTSASSTTIDDGVFRAPGEIPSSFNLTSPQTTLDLSAVLARNQLSCTLRDAPEWLAFQNGVLSLKSGADFDRIEATTERSGEKCRPARSKTRQ